LLSEKPRAAGLQFPPPHKKNPLDNPLVLPKAIDAEFWQELKAYEEERKVPYITSVERIGYERGREEGHRQLIAFLLDQKVGQLPLEISDRLSLLSLDQLSALGIALLNFNTMDDLTHWLETYKQ
jgi:hypothetical protein